MPKTLRYRLFKVGALPQALRSELANDRILFREEGVPVIVRRRGTAPGFKGRGSGRFSGALAVTGRRIVASISKSVTVDASYDAAEARGAELSLDENGLHVRIDASIHPQCTGEIEMHFKQQFTKEDLSHFPYRKLSFTFPMELVPKMFGVPG